MAYKLRFVQKFEEPGREEFLKLERQFADLEKKYPEFPKGKRYLALMGRDSTNTFIWESEYPSLEAVQNVLEFLHNDPRHEELFAQQCRYFLDSYVEVYETFLD